MPHFLFTATYSTEGVQGVLAEGASSRMEVVRKLCESLGGRLEAGYWLFGDADYIGIAELPDNAAAAALATRVSSSGTVSISTTVLLTAAEVDEARGRNPDYRPPGE